jgi:hypothetical protein
MTSNRKRIDASPEQVWAILANGWLYPVWMVGATAVRGVDARWPEAGSSINHATGAWPLTVDDTTRVVSSHPPGELTLLLKRWPLGMAEVRLSLSPAGSGGTQVTMEEKAVSGLGARIPDQVKYPLLRWRNNETLTRLGFVARGRRPRMA